MYKQVHKEKERLEKEIVTVRKLLEKLPPGNFFCTRSRNSYKWYYTLAGKRHYIYKRERTLAEKLAARRYLTDLLEDLTREKEAAEQYLKYIKSETRKSEQLLVKCPEYLNLISHLFKPKSKELKEWSESSYPSNPLNPKQCNVKSVSGKLVRSKSESIIDTFLYLNKIPYRYECQLILGNKEYYPDFTIRHPRTGKIYYWEHLGKVDDPEYERKALAKLHTYMANGIVPFGNLILTFETKEEPLDGKWVETIIRHYFLDE